MARSRKLLLILLLALTVAACAPLAPLDRPAEYTAAPARTPLWRELEPSAPESWHALLNDGPGALDWRLRAIDSASESIDFQTFLWHFDTAGALVLDHLVLAADRGVTVRILLDDTFLVHEDELLLALAKHPNIQYRVFNPFKRRSGGLATRQFLNLAEFSRLDHRMHNKALVVDNRVAIVGGRNIADEYFGLDDGANFRDLELILGGDIALGISAAFDAYWNDRWSFPIEFISHRTASPEQLAHARELAGTAPHLHRELAEAELLEQWKILVAEADGGDTRLYVDKPPEDSPEDPEEAPVAVANELVALFDAAHSEIIIVSAYLIPTPHLEGAVTRALGRGVRVRILTNSIGSNNHLAAHSAYRNHIDTLLENGAEVHEVRIDAKGRSRYMLAPIDRKTLALHAKALIIDYDKVFIGSANLDPRSLKINTEMGLLVTSEAFNASVREAIEPDFSHSNAWRLELRENDEIYWVSDDRTLDAQPALSFMQRLEDWFLSLLPIENKM